jgi:hypothetical protein
MVWQSTDYSKSLLQQFNNLIPDDFDYKIYIDYHPDLQAAGIDTEQKAKEHFLFFGRKEGRIYRKVDFIYESHDNNYISEPWKNCTNKNVLYFSPNAPDYDMSSGGNRLLQILKILKNNLN